MVQACLGDAQLAFAQQMSRWCVLIFIASRFDAQDGLGSSLRFLFQKFEAHSSSVMIFGPKQMPSLAF